MTDKEIICAEIEKLRKEYDIDTTPIAKYQIAQAILNRLSDVIDSLQEEPVSSIWHNARETVPENSTSEILCYRENESSVVTIGKIVNGTIKWAYLKELLNRKEEPVSEDLEKVADKYVIDKKCEPWAELC